MAVILPKEAARVVNHRARVYILVSAALVVTCLLLQNASWRGTVELHTLMELFATLLALVVGAMALVRHYSRKDNVILLVGTAFLGAGLLDGYHMLVSSNWLREALPSGLPSLVPWSWVASRLFLACAILISCMVRRRNWQQAATRPLKELRVYSAVALATGTSFLFFALMPLPDAHYPGIPFHRPQELFVAILFLLALIECLRHGRWRQEPFEYWLVLALIVSVATQALFMPFSAELFDLQFDAAHFLKIVSYLCVLIGLFASMYRSFRQVESESRKRRRAEAELVLLNSDLERRIALRTRELARSNAELQQFAYVASHDLQEPLRMVSSYLQLLEKRYKGKLDDDADEFIHFAVDGAQRMKTLINDLLSLSRVDSRGKPFAAVDMQRALQHARQNLEVAIADSHAQISCGPLPVVAADAGQLAQLLQNLIGNAIKYRGAPAPTVHVSAEPVAETDVELPESVNAGGWLFSVRDNGIGIAPEYAEEVFRIFRRLHSNEQFSGTGIGLAICKKIVQRHGGSIWVESSGDGGSTFYFTIPDREPFAQPDRGDVRGDVRGVKVAQPPGRDKDEVVRHPSEPLDARASGDSRR